MTDLAWTFNGDTHIAIHEPYVCVIQPYAEKFDYLIFDKTATTEGGGRLWADAFGSYPVASGTVFSLERAKACAGEAVRMLERSVKS